MTFDLGGQRITAELHLDVALLCLGLLVGYLTLLRRHGPVLHPGPGRPARPRQVAAFVAGVGALWLASGSPLHDLADSYLFSAHMVQHLLQAFVIAPLLVVGTPGWMLEWLTRDRRVRAALRTAATPLVAFVVFNGVLLAMHVPQVVQLMIDSEAFHAGAHTTLVLSSLLVWLPLLSTSDAVVGRMSPPARMGYLFGMTILPTVPASFLTFGDPTAPVYPGYGIFPRLWGITVGEDMLISGLIMKIGGGFLLWGIIATMFFRWAAANDRADRAGRAGGKPDDLTPAA